MIPQLEKINDVYAVSSRIIADQLGKEHNRVLKDINKILKESTLEKSILTSLIISSTYKVQGQNRSYKEYLLTKDGFTLYMFNIQGYQDFKMAYIQKFNEMEKALVGKQKPLDFNFKNFDYDNVVINVKSILNNLKAQLLIDRAKIDDKLRELDSTGLTSDVSVTTHKGVYTAMIDL